MVRIGFIVEGDSEKIMIESPGFKDWANSQGIEICSPVINAKGGGNLLPHHLGPMVTQLERSNPDHIVILTDLEDAADVATVKARVTEEHTRFIFVAVKALEAWFLADTDAMRNWLNRNDFFEASPEQTERMPWDRIKEIAIENSARGPGSSKVIFARKFCGVHNYQISKSAAHPECRSAKEFHDQLVELANLGRQQHLVEP